MLIQKMTDKTKIEKINLENEPALGKKIKPTNNPAVKKKNENDKLNNFLNKLPSVNPGQIKKTTSFEEDNQIYAPNVMNKKEKNMDDFFGIINEKEVYNKPVVKKKFAAE